MLLLIFFSLLFVYLYLRVIKPHTYWEKKGIPYLKPWPFFGNMASTVFRRRALQHLVEDFYAMHSDKRYVGFYKFSKPTLLIRDPELIKQITIKDFETFPNHDIYSNKEVDTLMKKSLFNLDSDEGWYDMRAMVSPYFTTSKLRTMFASMKLCADQFVDNFNKERDIIAVEMKDAFTRYANDVIATTVFGYACNSLANRENKFYLMGKELVNFNGMKGWKFFGYSISPMLMKLFKISVFNRIECEFFGNIIKESIRVREEKQIIRPDLIYWLMKAREGPPKDSKRSDIKESATGQTQERQKLEITDDDITAQALIFFFAGFDTTSTLMSFVSYELALNPAIQRKLREEVDATLKCSDEQLTYEALVGMKYLDKVISETLRKWPPVAVIDRRARKPFIVEADKPGEKLLYLESGTVCWIPVFPIHRDPKYYPEPERFDPERFSDENKHKIKPFTFLPFGSGPRHCVGSRFALLETKLIILRIIQKFEIVPIKRTQIPLKLSKKNLLMVPDAGFWLGLKPRTFYT